jgi:hypothetical protein
LFGLNKRPQELFLKDLVLMQESTLFDLSFENLLSKGPVLGKEWRNNVQEVEGQRVSLVVYFL